MSQNLRAQGQYMSHKIMARAQWQVYYVAMNDLRYAITSSYGDMNEPLPFALTRDATDRAEQAWSAMQTAMASANAVAADCGQPMLVVSSTSSPQHDGPSSKEGIAP